MPRVLRIINRFNLGGPTHNVALLTRYMAPEFETLLVAGSKQDSEEGSEFLIEELGINSIKIPSMRRTINPADDYAAFRHIKKIIREFKPDIVHTHAAKAGALGRLAGYQMKVPVILHTFHGHVFHSYFNPIKTKIILHAERFLAKRTTAIVAISASQKEDLSSTYRICSPEKIRIIPLGLDFSKFRERQHEKRKAFRDRYVLKDDEIAIGIIGRLVPIKNHSLFLQAIRILFSRCDKKICAFIIGDGEEKDRIIKTAAELGLNTDASANNQTTSRLYFTSWMKDIDVAMAGLDIIVLTSLNEGTPVSLVEAQAAGKAIVATNVGGVRNVVVPGQTALLSESGNAEDLVSNLVRIIGDERLRLQMGQAGWENVRDNFHYTRLIADMSKLYHELL